MPLTSQIIRAIVKEEIQAANSESRAETRADIQSLRTETKADLQSLRAETRADIQSLRTETKTDIQDLRTDNEKTNQKLDKLLDNMDWLIGEYKKQDEEQLTTSYHISKHSDRLENLETKVFGSAQV